MPELKHNFVKGRMNKDFDERLVPKGEYRDALNVEVSTSESSNVGSVQNLKGNTLATTHDQNSSSFTLSDNAITVGSYTDESTKTIFNFIHKASDLTSTGTFSGQSRFEGYRSDVISMYTALSSSEDGIVYPLVTDVYETRIRPTDYQTSQNGIITGVPTSNISSVSFPMYFAKGVTRGMRVRLLAPSGSDLYAGEKVIVKGIIPSSTAAGVKIITTIPNTTVTFNSVTDLSGHVFQFTSDRILNFQHGPQEIESNTAGTPLSNTPDGTMITGINYQDGILFYTDGRTEPKRIVVSRFKLASGDYDPNASITRHSNVRITKNANLQFPTLSFYNATPLKEDFITVIRKNPTTPPVVTPITTKRKVEEIEINGNPIGVFYIDATTSIVHQVVGTSAVMEFAMSDASQVVWVGGQIFTIKALAGNANWRVGDVLDLTGSLSTTRARVSITQILPGLASNEVFFEVSLIEIDEDYSGASSPEGWQAQLVEKDAIYLDKFIYFAYRYKYIDGEFSCISPYSTSAFVPGFFSYNPKNGFNRGMESICKFIKITDFVPHDIPEDVESVELLLKDSSSEIVQIIKEIKRSTGGFVQLGTHANGSAELNSESFGSSVPSDQLLRPFDAIPRIAKAQEFSGSRLLYGNYIEGYDLKSISSNSNGTNDLIPSITQSLKIESTDFISNVLTDNGVQATQTSSLDSYPQLGSTTLGGYPQFPNGDFPTNFPGSGNTGNLPGDTNRMLIQYGNHHSNNHTPWPGWAVIPFNQENDPGSNWNLDNYYYVVEEPGQYDFNISVDFAFVATRNWRTFPSSGTNHHYRASAGKCKLIIAKVDVNGNLSLLSNTYTSPYGLNAIDPDSIILAGPTITSNGVSGVNGNLPIPNSGTFDAFSTDFGSNSPHLFNQTPYKTLELNDGINTSNPKLNTGDRLGVFIVTEGGEPGLSASHTSDTSGTFAGTSFFPLSASTFNEKLWRLLKVANSSINISAPHSDQAIVQRTGGSSVKSLRTYEIGVVYLDGKGRESTVILDESSTEGANVKILKTNCATRNKLQVRINHLAPYWAEYYKFFIKEIGPKYNNIVLYKAYPNDHQDTVAGQTTYVWLSFNSSDVNKVTKDDYLVLKKEHGENIPVTDVNAKYRVLDIVGAPEKVEDDLATPADESGFEIKGIPIQASKEDISGKFFVKVEADDSYAKYINSNDTLPTEVDAINNGAVFEVEKPLNLDLDLFYEASQAYPIRLTESDNKAKTFIKIGAEVSFKQEVGDPLYSLVSSLNNGEFKGIVQYVKGADSISNAFYETLPVNDDGYFCKIVLSGSFPQGANTSIVSYSNPMPLEIESVDEGTVVVYCVKVDGSEFYIHPFTHKITSSDYWSSRITLPWTNCYTFGNGVESDRIRDDFNANTTYPYLANGKAAGFKASMFLPSYREVDNKNDIIFSQVYNDATNTARYNEFIAAQDITKKLNSEYGSIQKLYTRQGDVLAFCENKVLKILASKDALFNADGNPQLLSSTAVLGQAIPFGGDYGISTNPESFAVEEYRIYFADRFRGAICRLSMDGITAISDQGMKDFFNDNLETASALVGSYDGKKNEYNLTIHSSTNPAFRKNVYTVSYSEGVKGWTSFKSWIKESGLSMSNEYYTFKNGDMYLHHPDQTDVSRNNFYGTQYTSSVSVLFNDFSGSVKLFKTINYEGTQAKEL